MPTGMVGYTHLREISTNILEIKPKEVYINIEGVTLCSQSQKKEVSLLLVPMSTLTKYQDIVSEVNTTNRGET